MKMRLIIGPAQTGKTEIIHKQFLSSAAENQKREADGKEHSRTLLVVPERINLTEQRMMIQESQEHALMGADILSFHRIAHHVIEEAGESQLEVLDEVGKSMMLYRIVCEEIENLHYFSSSIKNAGFLIQLKDLFAEFAQYEVDKEKLEQALTHLDPASSLHARLSDLILIAQRYDQEIAQNGDINEKLLDRLYQLIPETTYLKKACVYIDGFADFPPQVLLVLSQILRYAQEVTISITLPKEAAKAIYQMTGTESRSQIEKKDLFDSSRRTLFDLLDLVRGLHIPLETVYTEDLSDEVNADEASSIASRSEKKLPEDTQFEADCPEYCENSENTHREEIRFLANEFFRYPPRTYHEKSQAVHLSKVNGIRSEVDLVCRQILTLIRSHQYEYHQIGIMVGGMEEYRQILRQTAAKYRIPVFMDERSAAISQPYIRMILSMLQMVKSRCSYESFMSFLKTGFSPLSQQQVDSLENMALMHGTRSFPGFVQKIRVVIRMAENRWIVDKWLHFLELFYQKAQENESLRSEEWCLLLENYLQSLGTEELLEKQADDLKRSGHDQQSLQTSQLFEKSAMVLKRIREITGDTFMDVQTFYGILAAGFREMQLGNMPGKIDEVIVGELSRSHLRGLKILFIMGFSETSFPRISENTGLLSEREREKLAVDFRLIPGSQVQFYDQQFRFYQLLSSISDHVFVSYDASTKGGEEKRPSLYWNRFSLILGEEVQKPFELDPWSLPEPQLEAYLLSQEKDPRLTTWFQSHNYQKQLDNLSGKQVDYHENIGAEYGRSLNFPDNTEYSITRLESFAACPMKHFLQYGMGLRSREILETSVKEDGTILHKVMESAGNLLQQIYSDQEQTIADRVQAIFEKEKEEFEAYQENSRSRYFWRKLQSTAQRALTTLKEQVDAGTFHPEHFEWSFGNGAGSALPPIRIPLEEGTTLNIKGVIDRVDVLEKNGCSFVRILDYKSGDKAFSITDIQDGVSLQLPVYLKAVSDGMRSQGREVRPAGIFYFHLIPKVVGGKENHKLTLESGTEEKAKIAQDETRLSGIMSADPEVYVGMGEKEITRIFPARFKKDGQPFSNETKVRSREEIEGLCRFTLKKMAEMAEKIQKGDISMEPYQGKTLTCEWCEFRESCRFDRQESSAPIRQASKVQNKDFWNAMRKIEAEGKEG